MVYEESFKSMLQGVSQQLPKLRLDGQVSVQENMLSDPVTNGRRRPGAIFTFSTQMPGETNLSIRTWETDVAGQRVHIVVGSVTGAVKILSENLQSVVASLQSDYLKTTAVQKLRATTIGNDFYLLNTGVKPYAVAAASPGPNPAYNGFFYIKAGAFSKSFVILVTTALGTATLQYTTPTGATAGDAAAAVPEYIANVLCTGTHIAALAAIGVVATRSGAYVHLVGSTPTIGTLAVASSSGSNYITASSFSKVRSEGDLPAHLPPAADGYIVAVGEQKLYRYYKYVAATTEWLEAGTWDSPGTIAGMPVVLRNAASVWTLDTTPYEGRTAGDQDTNPIPEFLTRGLSGMGSFQSRLVLLGGSKVYLSSSTAPKRFMRSTVTGLLDADPIAVGASANSSAEYEYAVPFQKDLLLFSKKYQALIPAGNTAITPRTATVLLTSAHSVDLGCEPVAVGRTLLFAAPRSSDFFGFMEMVSSQFTDSQYVANDATSHLPKYMGGSCRFAVSSPVSSMVLFGPSKDENSVIVYEYRWNGDVKEQQAWHRWTLPYPVATAHFAGDAANIIFCKNGYLVGVSLDTKAGAVDALAVRRPFLDMHFQMTVVDNKATIPQWALDFDPDIGTRLKLAVATGPMAGELVGSTYAAGVFTTVRSFPAGLVTAGIPFKSSLSPTAPVVRDRHGAMIESAKLTVLRYGVSTQNSAEYSVKVSDSQSIDPQEVAQATLSFSSIDLQPGAARVSTISRSVVPARTNAATGVLLLTTSGLGEMNFTGIDFTARFNQRHNRR